MKHLIIPDCHVKPKQNLSRFQWLGKHIIDVVPDKIICLGDFADMESLCSYDKGTKSFENRRFIHDVRATKKAMNILLHPINELNNRLRKNRKKLYSPELYMCLGNHEDRINKAVEVEPVLEGVISTRSLGFEDSGWDVLPYQDILQLDGIHYSHIFVSGIMGRNISGEHPAYTLLQKKHVSCVVGHNHTFDYKKTVRADGKRINGLVAGCFLEHREDYAKQANDLWISGITVLHDVKDGDYDIEFISIERLREKYGNHI